MTQLQKTPLAFVELMARSHFSFLQGASFPHEMVEQAQRLNYSGISLTDLNGLYGIARGLQAAKAPSHFTASVQGPQQFRYHFGTELSLTDGTQIVLTPLTLEGYSQLCQLITKGKRNVAKYFTKITWEDLIQHNQDLLIFPLPSASGQISEERFLFLQNLFTDRLYLPVWRDLTWESLDQARLFFDWERKYGAELFVTQRPLMHAPERKPVFDLLTCIHHHTTLENADAILTQNSERYLRPLEDLRFLWRDRLDLVQKTISISDRIEFQLDQIRYHYPQARLPKGVTANEHLRTLSEQGAHWRYPEKIPSKVTQQINHELSVIADLDYADYFLTLHDICQFAQNQGILFQGRGSAANSVVCFCLGLTAVDPEQVDLLFERFISRERAEPPDIDIDFEHSRREEVIQYIFETYNEEHAAMVCTVIRYKSRMALRETAKVLGVPLITINKIIKFMGRDGYKRLIEKPKIWQQFKIDEWRWQTMLSLAQQIHGFPRHIGIHTGGFLITQEPITRFVPVEKATMNGRYVIQWNKDDVNDLKLMKIDVLSLGMLTALRKALTLLRDHKNIDWNLAQIPHDDQKTYAMITRADTVGVFQIESRAQMNTLPRMKPKNFYDLVIEVALIRPGPLQGGMVHPFLRRRAGLEDVHYPHPDFKSVLQKTMGVPIFQEQVMKMAIVGAGFSPGEADELRRVMSAAWRKKGTMEGIRNRIITGLIKNKFSETSAEQVYKTIEGFANYGFPESHAASFALLTYASCYIKCHHPDVFVCSLLNSQPMGFYAPRVLVAEAQRNGVEFLPIDIQRSNNESTLEKFHFGASIAGNQRSMIEGPSLIPVRLGFSQLQGFPKEHVQKILAAREQHGDFTSLKDFVMRVQLPKSSLVKLAAAEAFSSFGETPRELIWKIESLSLDQQSFLWGESRESFIEDSEEAHESSAAPSLPFESNWARMGREYKAQGYSLDLHPMSILRFSINERNEKFKNLGQVLFVASNELTQTQDKNKVRIAGAISITQRPPTAKGFCFITLEDEWGFINIVVPPDVYQKDRITIYSRSLLEIRGHIERSGSLINVKAERVLALN